MKSTTASKVAVKAKSYNRFGPAEVSPIVGAFLCLPSAYWGSLLRIGDGPILTPDALTYSKKSS